MATCEIQFSGNWFYLGNLCDRSEIVSKIGFSELLLLMFIYLKLTNSIDWDWWVVFSPVYVVILISTITETIKRTK